MRSIGRDLIPTRMNLAIQSLETIYSTTLVKECHPEDLKQFKRLVEKFKNDLIRKNRVQFYVNLLRDGRMKAWRQAYKEAEDDWNENNVAFSMYPWHMRDHEWTIIGESLAIYEKEEKEKKLAEQKLKEEEAKKKQQEEELLEEAKRRLACQDREKVIQDLMARLSAEQPPRGSQ